MFLERNTVEVLVNNAAAAPELKCLTDLTALDYQRTFSLNVYVPYRLMQAAVRSMKLGGSGTIVNICSLAGRRAIRNAALYCSSKFALRGLTESIAQEVDYWWHKEWAGHEPSETCDHLMKWCPIKVFSVSPGGMTTQMRQDLFKDAAKQQNPAFVAQVVVDAIAGRIPVGQGEDLVVRQGEYAIVPREQWVGITLNPGPAVQV